MPPGGPLFLDEAWDLVIARLAKEITGPHLSCTPGSGVVVGLTVRCSGGEPVGVPTADIEADGIRIRGSFTPSWVWDFGDEPAGSTVGIAGGGRVAHHDFSRPGSILVRVGITWRGRMSIQGVPGSAGGPHVIRHAAMRVTVGVAGTALRQGAEAL